MENEDTQLIQTLPPYNSKAVLKTAFAKTHQYFLATTANVSFSVILVFCAFVPFWVLYINQLGEDHFLVRVVEGLTVFSLQIVVLVAISIYLFNQTHTKKLLLWPFTKKVTLPWLLEGLKASVIICLGYLAFFVPGVIKTIHYTFFTFVVFFNKQYKKGNISALKHSKKLSSGLAWWLFGCYIVYYIVYFFLSYIKDILLAHFLVGWNLFLILGVYTYLVMLPCIYLMMLFYFIYEIKDKEHIIDGHESP